MRQAIQKTESHKRLRLSRLAEPEIWTERMLDALGNGVLGNKWYSLIDKMYREESIRKAWKQVKRNKGAAGIDRQSIERFAANEDQYLKELTESLKEGRFQPSGIKRVYIPKGKGKRRPLGIPVVKDRIVQTALLMVIQPIFENEFTVSSFGFRPMLGCKDALRLADKLRKSHQWAVDVDFSNYFDTIPHDKLLERIKERISDRSLLKLIESFLKAEIIDGLKCWKPTKGAPQGAVLSPLLSNIYLHPLDQLLVSEGYKPIRYADDLVILCDSEESAQNALSLTEEWARENALSLHPEKTRIGNHTKEGQGFEFLGYRFECGKRLIRRKSLKSLKDKVRRRTKRTAGMSIEQIISELNPILRGWFEHFKHASKRILIRLDQFIRRRLRSILRRQKKWPRGQGHADRDHRMWPIKFFANYGLFTMAVAHKRALQSR